MNTWVFAGLPVLSLWIAILEADGVLIGQWMFSRPLIVGPVIGLLLGDPASGLTLGALFELFCLDRPPVGGKMPFNGTVAAGGAVLFAGGPHAAPLALAFPAGLALGCVHRFVESRIRDWRSGLSLRAAGGVESGGRVDWDRLLLPSIGLQVGTTALLLYLSGGIIAPWAVRAWDAAPVFLREGFESALRTAPWIGLGLLVQSLWRRK
ncbi:MAG: PTS sugar transporter subunit IIC [Elusimicrobiota bacterium]